MNFNWWKCIISIMHRNHEDMVTQNLKSNYLINIIVLLPRPGITYIGFFNYSFPLRFGEYVCIRTRMLRQTISTLFIKTINLLVICWANWRLSLTNWIKPRNLRNFNICKVLVFWSNVIIISTQILVVVRTWTRILYKCQLT